MSRTVPAPSRPVRGDATHWAVAMPSCLRNLPSRSHGWASLESGLRRRPSTASRTVRRRTRVPASKPCRISRGRSRAINLRFSAVVRPREETQPWMERSSLEMESAEPPITPWSTSSPADLPKAAISLVFTPSMACSPMRSAAAPTRRTRPMGLPNISMEPIATIRSRIISADHCAAATEASAPSEEKTSFTSNADTLKEASVTEARFANTGSRCSSAFGTCGTRSSSTSNSSREGSDTYVAPMATVALSRIGHNTTFCK
mmetsp:Transcript_25023/g.68708  ORF Transcript_25023/g.68708 Transcript_25023/m.68708 type:complete len:260 (+) Transcript_25023:1520-2299(+)